MICFELIFEYRMRFVFCLWMSSVPALFVELGSLNSFVNFDKNQSTIYVWVFFWIMYSVLLMRLLFFFFHNTHITLISIIL